LLPTPGQRDAPVLRARACNQHASPSHFLTTNPGAGGTFALYSLICRAAGFGPYGPSQPVDMHFLTGGAGALASRLPRGATRGHWWSLQTGLGGRVRAWYRRSQAGQVALLVVVMLATAMVIGDGVLTPSISGESWSVSSTFRDYSCTRVGLMAPSGDLCTQDGVGGRTCICSNTRLVCVWHQASITHSHVPASRHAPIVATLDQPRTRSTCPPRAHPVPTVAHP
jgi:hypothetical protein